MPELSRRPLKGLEEFPKWCSFFSVLFGGFRTFRHLIVVLGLAANAGRNDLNRLVMSAPFLE